MTVRNVFIVMPFSEQSVATADGPRVYPREHFDDIYATLTEAVHHHDPAITVDRMEEQYGNIVNQVIRRLATADVVIAVLSGKNPNVFYELGIRHSLRRNTIMLVEYRDEYPFDLSSHFSKTFSVRHQADREELREFIKERLTQYDQETLPDSPVFEVLNQAEYDQTRAINAWETRRASVVFHGLIGEVTQFFNVLNQCFDYMGAFTDTERPEERPPMNILWDMIEGFRHNRPMPGLPVQAYSDAENIYRTWKSMELTWNEHMNADGDVEVEVLEEIIGYPFVASCAFAYDTVKAAEYVMRYKTSFAIPWQGSLGMIEGYDFQPVQLGELHERMIDELTGVIEKLEVFDREFIGVPSDAILAIAERKIPQMPGFDRVLEEIGVDRIPDDDADAGGE